MSIFDKLRSQLPPQTPAPQNPEPTGKKETFTFADLPESLAQLQALPEAALTSPFQTAALTVCALCAYAAEPEAGIDLWSFQNLIRVFEKMYEQTRGSILIISHQERILNIADTIVLLKNGRVAEYGPRGEVLPRLLRNIDTAPPVCSMLSGPIKEVR